MVGYWFYKFQIEDRDIAVVDYEQWDETEVDLPIAGICVANPFLEENILAVFPEFKETTYLKHLKGDIWDDEYDGIDYAKSTLDLNEYLLSVGIVFRNGSRAQILNLHNIFGVIFDGVYHQGAFVKCFAHRLQQQIKEITYAFNRTRMFAEFEDSVSPYRRVLVSFHYPRQFLLTLGNYYGINTSKFTTVAFGDIEVLKARKTRKRNCMENWMSYDDFVLRKHIAEKGCVPPYHTSHHSFARCQNETEVKAYLYDYIQARSNYYPLACSRMTKIGHVLQGRPYDGNTASYYRDYWNLWISYPDNVRVIHQSKEVDAHSLIGNIGGYVGLFLGSTNFDQLIIFEFFNRSIRI